jgi:hypothetical protein
VSGAFLKKARKNSWESGAWAFFSSRLNRRAWMMVLRVEFRHIGLRHRLDTLHPTSVSKFTTVSQMADL